MCCLDVVDIHPSSMRVQKQNNVEWNVNYVKAPTVWSEFGTTGTGIYANADTGVSVGVSFMMACY